MMEQKTVFSPTGVPGKPIIVLGVDRSGTSVIANIVDEWGASGGVVDRPEQDFEDTHAGYFENHDLHEVLDRIFDSISGGQPELVEMFDSDFRDTKLTESAINPKLASDASAIVQSMGEQSAPWYWKEPLLSLLLPFWMKFWGEAAYIVAVRNPEESARSWQKYVETNIVKEVVDPVPSNILRWQIYLMAILRNIQDQRWRLFVSYEDLMDNPEHQSVRIARFLNSFCEINHGFDAQIARMQRVVDQRLWRNRSESQFNACVDATPEQKSLYEYLQRSARDEIADFDERNYPLPVGWKSSLAYRYLCNEFLAFPPSECIYRLFLRRRIEKFLSPA